MFSKIIKSALILPIILLGMLIATPIFANGPEAEVALSVSSEDEDGHGEEDGHSEENEHGDDEDSHGEEVEHGDDEDSHGVDDGHGEPASPLGAAMPLIGGIVGALLLAGGGGMWRTPRPNYLTLFGLALIGLTGILHLVVGLQFSDTLLILNGIGFIGLGVLWIWPQQFIPNQRKIVAAILIVYTLITIVGYFATHDHYDFVAISSKVVEVLLLVVLGISLVENDTPETGAIDA